MIQLSKNTKMLIRICLVIVFGLYWQPFTNPLLGDLLLIKGESNPMYGVVVNQDENQVTFRPWNEDGSTRQQVTAQRSNIEVLVITIDASRLKDSGEDYDRLYSYAEELAAMKKDPASRAAAQQLFRRIASNTKGSLRANALRALLSPQGPTSRQHQLLGAYALIAEPAIGIDEIRAPNNSQLSMDPVTLEALINAVTKIRTGSRLEATETFKNPRIRALDEIVRPICSIQALYEYSLKPELDDEQLAVLLLCESHLRTLNTQSRDRSNTLPKTGQWTPEFMRSKGINWPDLNQR